MTKPTVSATPPRPRSSLGRQPIERVAEQGHAGGPCEPTFETRDFYLACYLRCLDFQMLDVRREPTHCVFVFRDQQPERRSAVIAYYNEDGEVSALEFVAIIKEMKALIHNV